MSLSWSKEELIKYSIFPCEITLADCQASIAGMNCFRVAKKDDYVVVNYDYAFRETFPDPKTAKSEDLARLHAIRRECRGIIFDSKSGALLVRRFHKFFNINELDETTSEKINLDRPHLLLEKADGSLVTPVLIGGRMFFGTKMGATGITDDVSRFIDEHPHFQYRNLSAEVLALGWTPLFEFCAISNQVVLEYPEDHLFLTAVRHNASGVYLKWPELCALAAKHKVPTVSECSLRYQRDYHSAAELLDMVKKIEHVEGYVLVFENGEMYKLKTNWYIERSKKQAANFSTNEKDLFKIILEGKLDDLGDAIGESRRAVIEAFGKNLIEELRKSAARIDTLVANSKQQGLAKKQFVEKMNALAKAPGTDPLLAAHLGLVLSAYDVEGSSFDLIRDFVLTSCVTLPRLNKVRVTLCGNLSIKL